VTYTGGGSGSGGTHLDKAISGTKKTGGALPLKKAAVKKVVKKKKQSK